MEDQVICQHYTEEGKLHYKIWSKTLAEKWKLNVVYVGSYENCLIKMATL